MTMYCGTFCQMLAAMLGLVSQTDRSQRYGALPAEMRDV